MNFEPQKFFVGLIDFFAIWIPGAVLTYLLLGGIGPHLDRWPQFGELGKPEAVVVFLFASYLLGHFIFLIGSWGLDGYVYEPIRNGTKFGLIKRLAKGGESSWGLSRLLARWLVNQYADEAVDRAEKLKKHYLDPLQASDAVNAFQWSKARLMLEKPQALETVQRFEADSKFFRSLLVVLAVLLVWAVAVLNWLVLGALAILILLAFWRYIEQRLKATSQAYWYVITLESQRENGYRPLPSTEVVEATHAGGVVYRERWKRVKYLLVQARKSKDHWVLPKGRIERGESTRETAVREVHEETGVWARVEDDLGVTSFALKEKNPIVHFYLMRATTKAKRREKRAYAWLSFEKALAQATHPESRNVLKAAEEKRALLP